MDKGLKEVQSKQIIWELLKYKYENLQIFEEKKEIRMCNSRKRTKKHAMVAEW